MNPTTLAHLIQQLITTQEENDALIEECARLNSLLHPQPQPENPQPSILTEANNEVAND